MRFQNKIILSKNRNILRTFLLIICDYFSILISLSISIGTWLLLEKQIVISIYLILFPLIILFIFSFAALGMYSIKGHNPIVEFKSTIIGLSMVYLILGMLSFMFKLVGVYSRAVFLISWILSILFVPLTRKSLIKYLCTKKMWGEDVIIIGLNERTNEIIELLNTNPEYGFNPVFILNLSPLKRHMQSILGIPIFTISKDLSWENLGKSSRISTAVIIEDESDNELIDHFNAVGFIHFNRIIVIPKKQLGSLWTIPFDIGGTLGYEIKQNLLDNFHRRTKRFIDLLLSIFIIPIVLPVCFAIAIAIKLDSRGPIFYKETRIGFRGKEFSIWKFRTMVLNAEKDLESLISKDLDLEIEWKEYRKLKNDPRITRVGRFLRRFSLDELPQVINIMKNEMSWVGPRPIISAEVILYKERYFLYKQVKPGLTGFWQVSGRNNLSYDTRTKLDEFYIHNYSIWIDLFIIYQTIFAVISNQGAY